MLIIQIVGLAAGLGMVAYGGFGTWVTLMLTLNLPEDSQEEAAMLREEALRAKTLEEHALRTMQAVDAEDYKFDKHLLMVATGGYGLVMLAGLALVVWILMTWLK